jgi:hypothetical protein
VPLLPIIKRTRFGLLEADKDTVLVTDTENFKKEKNNTCISSSFTNATDPDKLVKLHAKKKAPGTRTGVTNTDDQMDTKSVMA